MDFIITTLGGLLPNIPLYIIWITGIVLATNLRRSDGRITAFAAGGLMLVLANNLCLSVVNANLPLWLSNSGGSVANLSFVYGLTSVMNACIASVAWILILLAIFTGRD